MLGGGAGAQRSEVRGRKQVGSASPLELSGTVELTATRTLKGCWCPMRVQAGSMRQRVAVQRWMAAQTPWAARAHGCGRSPRW